MKVSELIQALARRIYIGGDTLVKVKVGEELFEVDGDDLHHGQVDEPDHVAGTKTRMVLVLPLNTTGVVKHPWCPSCKCEPLVMEGFADGGQCRGCATTVDWR